MIKTPLNEPNISCCLIETLIDIIYSNGNLKYHRFTILFPIEIINTLKFCESLNCESKFMNESM